VSPAEIAASILAELILARKQKPLRGADAQGRAEHSPASCDAL
jgi:xanthine/CO dehydrogenase XdhC/CoxF family maturation factor